jgi:hypothetical protein
VHHTPNGRLTNLQRKVLWLLKEAGAEDLPLILLTLGCRSADKFDAALSGLLDRGFVELYREIEQPGFRFLPLTKAEVQTVFPLREVVEKTADGWRWRSDEKRRAVDGAMLTGAGRNALTR